MSDLEDRLTALRPDGPPTDWQEVVRRARRRRSVARRRRIAVTVAIAALAVPALAVAIRGGWIVEAAKEDVPEAARLELPYVFGDQLRTPARTSRLARPVLAPLLGYGAALVIPSPDGRSIAYQAWHGTIPGERGTPTLRIHEPATGRDVVLEEGAQSLAWRADGAVAYMRALRPTYENNPQGALGGHFGHVVVAASPGAPATRWSPTPGAYVVRAWAGRTVLTYNVPSYVWPADQADRGVHAFDGPELMRPLPLDDVIAVSPDGALAAGPPRTTGDGSPAPFVVIVRVADGQVIARARLPHGIRSVYGVGSWTGDRIVASAVRGAGTGALLFLRYSREALEADGVIWLDRQAAISAGLEGFRGVGYGQPLFVDGEARRLVFRANVLLHEEERNQTMFVTCDRVSRVCRKGPSLRPLSRWAVVVHNPSRPLRGSP